jgi:hypothetical protein
MGKQKTGKIIEHPAVKKTAEKTIRIACRGAGMLPLDAIEEFQGNLKKRTKQDIEKIIKSIEKNGFTFPFFVWQHDGRNGCLDGHGRIKALCRMREEGWNLPLFPVVYIEAKNEKEAKQKLLLINSHYGNITKKGLADFISVEDIDFDVINISIIGDDFKKAYHGDSEEKAVITYPVIIAMNDDEYKKITDLKKRLKVKKDEDLIQILLNREMEND